MLISTKGRYALRVLIELAEGEDLTAYRRLDSIAEAQDISEKYLESIVSTMTKAKLLEGLRGRGGGYRLTKRPEEYSVGEVLRITDGSLAPVSCLDCDSDACPRANICKTLPMWQQLDDMITGYLDHISLMDLVNGTIKKP